MDPGKRQILASLAAGAALVLPPAARASPADAEAAEVPFPIWTKINFAVQSYADCVDRFDIAGLVALFTPDCVYDYAPALVMQGRDAVGRGARKALANVARSSHFVGPPVVWSGSSPGRFQSRVYFTATHLQKDGGTHTVCGRYVDIFVQDASQRLLISHRRTISHLAEGIDTPRYWLARNQS